MCVSRLFAKYLHQQSGTGPQSTPSSGLLSPHIPPLGFDVWGGEIALSKLLDLYSLLVKFYKASEGANGR